MTVILLIDDDPDICEIMKLFLERDGHQVRTAPGGREGLEILKSATPDLVLLDIMMQPMDGWETLTAIKENAVTRDLPVAIFSGKTPKLEEIIQYGPWIMDYILKPVDFRRISVALLDIVNRMQQQRKERGRLVSEGHPSDLIDRQEGFAAKIYLLKKFSREYREDGREKERLLADLEAELQRVNQALSDPASNLN